MTEERGFVAGAHSRDDARRVLNIAKRLGIDAREVKLTDGGFDVPVDVVKEIERGVEAEKPKRETKKAAATKKTAAKAEGDE